MLKVVIALFLIILFFNKKKNDRKIDKQKLENNSEKENSVLNKNSEYEISTENTTSVSKKGTKVEISYFNIVIPENILKLLWFADGKYANYNYLDSDETEIDIEGVKIKLNVSLSSDKEPSLIHTKLPVKISANTSPMDRIGYYPTYESLAPEQRYIYLKWLENPFENTNIDIGYVFLFYYGLERYLFLKNSQEALKAILKLLNTHKNPSFFSYSFKCLLFYCIFSNDINAIKKLLEMHSGNTDLELYAKYIAKIPLFAEDIIELSSEVGFINKRYINMYPELFISTLEENLNKKFEKNSIDLEKYYSHSLETCYINPVANTSLRKGKIDIPDFLSSTELCSELYQLLIETHENVKQKLKERRKRNKISF